MLKTVNVNFVKLVVLFVVVASTLAYGSHKPSVAQDPYAGHTAVVGYAEIITDPAGGEEGRTVYLRKDLGDKRLTGDFVYGDPRRMEFNGGYAGITYAVDSGFQSTDATLVNEVGWMRQSILVWDAEACSDLGLRENAVVPGSTGIVRGASDFYADITQVGFVPLPLFVASPTVLGVTYTFIWIDDEGNPTDIDNNHKADVALREIYYNDAYVWADDGVLGARGSGYIDFPSVAIHEVGHGFSQAHFGSIGLKDGRLVANPDAVMNAIYGGIRRQLLGTDEGGHCSNWANWPIR